MATPTLDQLSLSDSEDNTSVLFASPTRASRNAKQKAPPTTDASQRTGESKYDAEAAREEALKRELESVRSINEVIEGVVESLEVAKGNMDTVSRTVTSASTLLNTWIRILSQTEHNQRLLLNPNWKGATADIADMENEQILKIQAAERRAAEEERRREDARRKAEEEERARQAGTATRGTAGARGTRGRGRLTGTGVGRGVGRGSSAMTGSGYVAGGSTSSSRGGIPPPARGGSGIGRGVARGRARGGTK